MPQPRKHPAIKPRPRARKGPQPNLSTRAASQTSGGQAKGFSQTTALAPGLPMLRTSERKDFKRCPQRWWWGWREGLRVSGPPNDKLWFGTGWHIVMAHRYGKPGKARGQQPLKVWRDWIGEEIPKIRVNVSGTAEYREEVYLDAAKLGEEMIGNYLDTYHRDERWSMIQVERPFEVIIVNAQGQQRVLFCGTYDGVYRDERDGSIWLLEHKTAKAIYTGHLTLDDQAGGYLAVAARELANDSLIPKGKQIKGIMYNFARKAPRDPRPINSDGLALNKDGSVSKSQPAALLRREPIIRTTRERNTIIQHMQAEVEHMDAFRSGSLPLYKNPTRDCSWDCNFYQMCVLHEGGGPDWEEFKQHVFHTEDPYTDHRKSAAGDD